MRRWRRPGTNGEATLESPAPQEQNHSAPVRVFMMKPLVDEGCPGEHAFRALPDIKEARASMEGRRSISSCNTP